MNNYIEYFTNFVTNNYDMNNELIIKKYYHSIRVAYLMSVLSRKMNLSPDKEILAFKIGLCHDLGRFQEVVRNGKFENMKFDHAAYSNKILYNDGFIKYMDIDEHLLFRKAIYLHNKKDLNYNLTHKEMFFANMLRDADKIDLLKLRTIGNRLDFSKEPSLIVLYNYMNDLAIDINNLHNKSDSVILYLSFIKDMFFDESYSILIEEDVLNSLLNIIDVSEEREDVFKYLLEKIKERRGKCYVR